MNLEMVSQKPLPFTRASDQTAFKTSARCKLEGSQIVTAVWDWLVNQASPL